MASKFTRVVLVFVIIAVFWLWLRVLVLEDNMFKFNKAVKTLAGGLMEIKRGGR